MNLKMCQPGYDIKINFPYQLVLIENKTSNFTIIKKNIYMKR